MPSPFPGMDPYLEDPAIWPGVHAAMLAAVFERLADLGQSIGDLPCHPGGFPGGIEGVGIAPDGGQQVAVLAVDR